VCVGVLPTVCGLCESLCWCVSNCVVLCESLCCCVSDCIVLCESLFWCVSECMLCCVRDCVGLLATVCCVV
jgi:hypothetical protein